jgi:hypothetical protein
MARARTAQRAMGEAVGTLVSAEGQDIPLLCWRLRSFAVLNFRGHETDVGVPTHLTAFLNADQPLPGRIGQSLAHGLKGATAASRAESEPVPDSAGQHLCVRTARAGQDLVGVQAVGSRQHVEGSTTVLAGTVTPQEPGTHEHGTQGETGYGRDSHVQQRRSSALIP